MNHESTSFGNLTVSRRRFVAGAAALGAVGALRFVPSVGAQSPTSSPVAFVLINLNTATEEELLTIPGMNNRMIREFMEYRPYGSIKQFRREIGKYVGEEQVAEWEKYVFVPIDVNNADTETLQQLPGVDEAIAQKLIDGRDFADNAAFLALLKSLVSATDFQNADKYLATAA